MNTTIPQCDHVECHEEIVKKVTEEMPDEELLYDLAELFKVFGDSTRIKILYLLFESEMCVCDIAALLNMTISAISHQLRVLKQSQLVRFRREGKTVYYSLADDHVRSILAQGMDHVCELQNRQLQKSGQNQWQDQNQAVLKLMEIYLRHQVQKRHLQKS